ncbi:MAG TPA: phage tail sheath C-terminal domain-containing protein [Saprospiraceae bacterium]|nr:phage tail sheath C-terminal domain-containing protein [Saprospiraceae bacterium]
MPKSRKYPGVYIEEQNAFPQSVVGVPTSVPAFIGYTPQASYRGQSYHKKPVKITSFRDFQTFFCWSDPPPPADPIQQYRPNYYLHALPLGTNDPKAVVIAGKSYALLPDPNTIYYLYNSIRLFYQNGGGDAYIVSVGTYGAPSGKSIDPDERIINQNVRLEDLLKGLAVLKKEQEPTIYVCPEATLLSLENNASLMQAMLLQNEQMGTAMSLLDIIGSHHPDPQHFMDDITTFRENTGTHGLQYGVAYFPFIQINLTQSTINYTNVLGGDLSALAEILGVEKEDNSPLNQLISEILAPEAAPRTTAQYHQALINVSPDYKAMMMSLREEINLLPVSGAMAGVYTRVDNDRGVWKAPANVSIVGVTGLPLNISHQQQENLNVDPVSGKSINAIRSFPGRGVLVWGARTLAGNNSEARYISVRRTLIYIEQSIKNAMQPFVFEPNDQNTWTQIRGMIDNFLLTLWRQGGLMGAKPADAYYVICGLGTSMTPQDIQDGRLIVMVGVAMVRPVEFMLIRLELAMTKP